MCGLMREETQLAEEDKMAVLLLSLHWSTKL